LNILFDRFFKFLNSAIREHTVDIIGTSSLLQNKQKHDFHQRTQNFNESVATGKGLRSEEICQEISEQKLVFVVFEVNKLLKKTDQTVELSNVNQTQEKRVRRALRNTGTVLYVYQNCIFLLIYSCLKFQTNVPRFC